jgi:hypothetical protein
MVKVEVIRVLLVVRNGFVNEQQVDKAITEFVRRLGPEVVRVRYEISTDWIGADAISFGSFLPARPQEKIALEKLRHASERPLKTNSNPSNAGV